MSLSCVSHSIDICTVAIKNIRNMDAVSTNKIGDIMHFNDSYIINSIHDLCCFPVITVEHVRLNLPEYL